MQQATIKLDRHVVAQCLTGLSEAFSHELSPAALELYFGALCDLSPGALKRACARAVRERRWFPRAAELRELAGNSAPIGDAEADWRNALAGDYAALSPRGRRALARIGGSYTLRHAHASALGGLRQAFVDAFAGPPPPEPRPERLLPEPGAAERARVAAGIRSLIRELEARVRPPEACAVDDRPIGGVAGRPGIDRTTEANVVTHTGGGR